jgi:hypothetical protein
MAKLEPRDYLTGPGPYEAYVPGSAPQIIGIIALGGIIVMAIMIAGFVSR